MQAKVKREVETKIPLQRVFFFFFFYTMIPIFFRRFNPRWRRKRFFIFHTISRHFGFLALQQCFYFYIALELHHIKK
jgi:hypothetical protein